MTISNISLSPSVRSSLTALTNTASLLQKTQHNLSTGKSVNSPSDNATVFYAAQNLLQQANDLSSVKNNLATTLTTLNAATDSISSVGKVVQQLQGIAAQALSTTDATARADLAKQYNALRPQLDQLVGDATFGGTNLLNNASNSLTVNLNTDGKSSLTIQGVDATSNGLGIAPAANNFATNADISAANAQLQAAQSTLNTNAANFGGNATLIQTRQDFTANLTNNLQTASSDLTTSDTNQEAANLLALQAQNALGIITLNVSGQTAQAVGKLF